MEPHALLVVADDDSDDQYFFQEAIRAVCPNGVETRFVLDGAQLLKLLRETANDSYLRRLIVLDLNMRVKDGRATLQDLKTDPEFSNIPVVVLTTSDNEEDRAYAKQNGATAYYQKPSSIVELVKIVRSLYKEYLN